MALCGAARREAQRRLNDLYQKDGLVREYVDENATSNPQVYEMFCGHIENVAQKEAIIFELSEENERLAKIMRRTKGSRANKLVAISTEFGGIAFDAHQNRVSVWLNGMCFYCVRSICELSAYSNEKISLYGHFSSELKQKFATLGIFVSRNWNDNCDKAQIDYPSWAFARKYGLDFERCYSEKDNLLRLVVILVGQESNPNQSLKTSDKQQLKKMFRELIDL